MHLAFATIKDIKDKLNNRNISPADLLDYYIKRFEKYDSQLGCALEIFTSNSILQKSSYITNNSFLKNILENIPGIIKDNICQKDRITSCASKILENFRSTYNASVIQDLKQSGALLIGRANMDEFAMGSPNETSAYKKVLNPWDTNRVPGGSSGGSAAAVAAGLVPWSLGSETGGSIRLPAAYCNLVGIKPTYGLISRYGLVAYASSLDQIGVMARTVYDNALVFSVVAGKSSNANIKDSSMLNIEKKNYTLDLNKTNLVNKLASNLVIGVIENALEAKDIDPEVYNIVKNALTVFEKLGIKIKYIKLPSMQYSAATYFIISRAEAASNLARFDGVRYGYRNKNATVLSDMYSHTRHNGFGQEVRARILIGNYVLSAGHAADFYQNAIKVQNLMRQEFENAFKDVNLLFLPTQSAPAFKIGSFDKDKLKMDLQDYYTAFANLVGAPAISVPCGFTNNGLPLGFQLVGPHLSEELLYQVAYMYEQSTDWHNIHPKGYED